MEQIAGGSAKMSYSFQKCDTTKDSSTFRRQYRNFYWCDKKIERRKQMQNKID